MTREQAREYINALLSSELQPAKKKNTYVCPFCKNGTGKDGDGISSKDGGKHWKCFKCDFSGDYLDILKKLKGIDNERGVFDLYNITIDSPIPRSTGTDEPKPDKKNEKEQLSIVDYTAYFLQANKILMKNSDGQQYIKRRGISLEIAMRYMIGCDMKWKHPKRPQDIPDERIIIPTSKYSYTARAINKTNKSKMNVGSVNLFNAEALTDKESSYIFIVEGAFDALSVIEAGGQAVGIGSVSNKNKFIQAVKNTPPSVPLILSLDVDENETGQKAQAYIKEELEKLGIAFYEVNINSKYNDPNEHLQKDRATFTAYVNDPLNTAQKQRKDEYMRKNAIINCLKDFIGSISEAVNTPATPTGFPMLDNELDGGFFEGLYFLGALSSIGKTSFCLQIGDQIAGQGQDVIIFSLEMSKFELISKSLSRLTFEADKEKNENGFYYARTNRQITAGSKYKNYNDREKKLIQDAVQKYKKEYAPNIFIHEGIGDIGVEIITDIVKDHISFTGNKPLVVIDYLQILQPFDIRATDKMNMDKSVLELKKMSRKYKIPILCISSFNRENYLLPVNMSSFKESGAIEYSSDVLLGLQFGGMDDDIKTTDGQKPINLKKIEQWKCADPRKVQLKILKNRNGATGGNIFYDYYPKFNVFKESKK